MNANELRIGNLVGFGSTNCRVYEIQENCFYAIYNDGGSLKNTTCKLQPIPLTEEWLLRFGFEKTNTDGDNAWLNLRYRFLNFASDESVGFKKVYLTLNNRMDIICLYVHQLQNLYFALTGEELTLKTEL